MARRKSTGKGGTKYYKDDLQRQAKELQLEFLFMSTELKNALSRGVLAACIFVMGEAKKKAPVDTGLLRASISQAVVEDGSIVTGYVGTNVEYAPFIELGRLGKPPKTPFLTPALNENKAKISAIIARALKEELK